MSIAVAGVDGCPGGWAVARWSREQNGERALTVSFAETLDGVVAELRAGRLAAVAVDMPIGLLADTRRASDALGRGLLGPRRSSIFATPARAALGSPDHPVLDHADASARNRAAVGVGLSIQAFHLLPKIGELDALVEPSDQDRFVEAHPELAFTRLAGAPLPHPKATAEGRALRRSLLDDHLGADVVAAALETADVPVTDALDALSLCTVAERVPTGAVEFLGDDVDPTGKHCRIAW